MCMLAFSNQATRLEALHQFGAMCSHNMQLHPITMAVLQRTVAVPMYVITCAYII